MKLKTVTLGCKVNQYETEFVREGLLGIGYEDAVDEQAADLCIVNTCTVTNEGDSKSRQVIRRLARENPDVEDRRDGLLRHAGAGRSRRAAERLGSRHRQARTPRSARPLRRHRRADRHQRLRPPASGVCEGARRLHAPLQLLHHPLRAAEPRQPARRAHRRRSPPPGRRRPPRGRAHRHSPRPLRRRLESHAAEGASGRGSRIWFATWPHFPATSAFGCRASKRPRSRAN